MFSTLPHFAAREMTMAAMTKSEMAKVKAGDIVYQLLGDSFTPRIVVKVGKGSLACTDIFNREYTIRLYAYTTLKAVRASRPLVYPTHKLNISEQCTMAQTLIALGRGDLVGA